MLVLGLGMGRPGVILSAIRFSRAPCHPNRAPKIIYSARFSLIRVMKSAEIKRRQPWRFTCFCLVVRLIVMIQGVGGTPYVRVAYPARPPPENLPSTTSRRSLKCNAPMTSADEKHCMCYLAGNSAVLYIRRNINVVYAGVS